MAKLEVSDPADEEFIDIHEVERETGLAKSTIYWRMSNDEFPRPVPVGERSRRWIRGEVRRWKAARIALRDTQAA